MQHQEGGGCEVTPSHTFYERQQVTLLPCRSLHEFTLDKFGKLDFLVNNGGGQFPCGAADMTLKVHILRIFIWHICIFEGLERCRRDQSNWDLPDVQGGSQAVHGGARWSHRQHHSGHVPWVSHDGAHR